MTPSPYWTSPGWNNRPGGVCGCDQMTDRDTFACPACGNTLDEIGCEKTVVCDECQCEWKCGDDRETLVEVEENDPIYWDR